MIPKLLILDCDGVLIDSEGIAARVVAHRLAEAGWTLSPAECERRFVGQTLTDIAIQAEPTTGPLGPAWVASLAEALVDALALEVWAMPGAILLVRALVARRINFRVASNSSREEMRVKFARTGLDRLIAPWQIHSAGDVMAHGGRGKPAPDLFLAVAAADGTDPADVWVVEDSVAGVAAATAAGMLCYGFHPGQENESLTALGAIPLLALADLLPLLQPDFCEAS